MAVIDRLPSFMRPGNPPDGAPTELTLGHTAPAVDPGTVKPRTNQLPLGASGRANFYGLPQPDELNRHLIGIEGLRRFDEMYRTDPHIRRLILMAWAPIMSGTWTLEPYGGDDATDMDRTVADTIWWGLTNFMSPNFFEHLATVGPVLLRSGFTPFEQIWGTCKYKGKTLTFPRKLDLRLPRSVWKWWQDDYGELTHIGQILVNKPDVVIPSTDLVYYRLASEGDNWVGTSLLRHAYKPWYYKDHLERIDAIGQERKAVGVPVVYPPTNADDQTRREVETVLANLHTNEVGYLMMPGPKAGAGTPEGEGWLVDVIKFDSSSGEGIQQSLQYHQDGIASSFLGDFMQLGHHQVGARATADVQEDPFLTAVDALAMSITPPLDALIKRICELNFTSVEGPPRLKLNLHDAASLSEIATYVQLLVAQGAMTVDPELEDWLRERADLPPANDDIRQQKLAAQQAGYQNAIDGPNQEPPGSEPPNPNDTPPAGGGKPGQPPPKPGSAGNREQQAGKSQPRKLDAPVTAKWWEQLLSQDRLKDALDGARLEVEKSTKGPAWVLAAQMAHQAANGGVLPTGAPVRLVEAFQAEYERLYAIGHQTVTDELAKQRRVLKLAATDTTTGAVAGSRLARARERARRSAQNVVNEISKRLGQATITGLKDHPALQETAQRAATGQLHLEALDNASASVNDGRHDAATAQDVVGGYYTSVMDQNSCDECVTQDDGTLLSVADAEALGPPNPLCAGQDRCRCMIVWVLSADPMAAEAVG